MSNPTIDKDAVKVASITSEHPLHEVALKINALVRKTNERQHAALLADQLCSAFCWADTPEGHNYWSEVARKLADLKLKEG